jgi:hypothetical protein
MSTPAKKFKPEQKDVLKDLDLMQKKIAAIKNEAKLEESMDDEVYVCADDQGDIILEEVVNESNEHLEFEETIDVNYILAAEQKIHNRINTIEGKLDQILSLLRRNVQPSTRTSLRESDISNMRECEEVIEEITHIEEDHQFIEIDNVERLDDMFPISDTATFDWFMTRIAKASSRRTLVQQQSGLIKTLSFKTLPIAVKHFINAHVELKIAIEYSVSGYGHHGKKKKKVDANVWALYIHDSFVSSEIIRYNVKEINKAVVQYFGRAPDVYGRRFQKNK